MQDIYFLYIIMYASSSNPANEKLFRAALLTVHIVVCWIF